MNVNADGQLMTAVLVRLGRTPVFDGDAQRQNEMNRRIGSPRERHAILRYICLS